MKCLFKVITGHHDDAWIKDKCVCLFCGRVKKREKRAA